MEGRMRQQIRFEIPKMNCAGCAGRIETALRGVEGVGEVHVNVADRSARVAADTAKVTDLTAALEAAGYPAREETVLLDLTGLSCASCAARVEAALAEVPGVQDIAVNYAALSARVTDWPGWPPRRELIQAVERAGYGATLPEAAQSAQDRDAAEARVALTRTIIAGALTLPVFIMEMGGHLIPALHHWLHGVIGQQNAWMLQFLLTTLVLAWPGRVFFAQGVPALLRGAPEMNALVALGTGAAWAFSTVALFLPGLLPEGARAVYFESAAVIVTLILLGRYLEARARGRTGRRSGTSSGCNPAPPAVWARMVRSKPSRLRPCALTTFCPCARAIPCPWMAR
jgi:copper ion binding protein